MEHVVHLLPRYAGQVFNKFQSQQLGPWVSIFEPLFEQGGEQLSPEKLFSNFCEKENYVVGPELKVLPICANMSSFGLRQILSVAVLMSFSISIFIEILYF